MVSRSTAITDLIVTRAVLAIAELFVHFRIVFVSQCTSSLRCTVYMYRIYDKRAVLC